MNIARKLAAELLGTALLLATVVGSGIMADHLANGNTAIALLGNTLATGTILVVLITVLGPVSGAHFNPVVSVVFAARRDITKGELIGYIVAQIVGAIAGVWLAHAMFGEPIIQISLKGRSGASQWLSEGVATFGLLLTILGTLRVREGFVAVAVGLYITAAYWFTASTSFANPAVTLARSLSDTFAGIRPADAPAFIVAQIVGALVAYFACAWLFQSKAINHGHNDLPQL